MPLGLGGQPVDEAPLPAGADCTMLMPFPEVEDVDRTRVIPVAGGSPEDQLRALGELRNGESFTVTMVESLADSGDLAVAIAAGVGPAVVVSPRVRAERFMGTAAGPAAATRADVDEALRLQEGGVGGDPPIFREVRDPTLTLEEDEPSAPWDGLGPDLSGVLRRLAAVRAVMPAPEVLVAGLAGDVAALVAEVRVRRAAGPSGRADVPHLWQEYNAVGNTCHFPGCGLAEDAHPRELPAAGPVDPVCDDGTHDHSTSSCLGPREQADGELVENEGERGSDG